jgi:hypothetical protein
MSENDRKPDSDPPKRGETPTKAQLLRFAEMFAVGTPLAEMVDEFNRSERSLRRWLYHPLVKSKVHEVRSALLSTMTGKAHVRLNKVLERLYRLTRLKDRRLQTFACNSYFDRSLRLMAFQEYEQRLAEVEERLGISKGRKGQKGAAT